MARLVIPTKFLYQIELLGLIKEKHDADGATSVLIPLLSQKGINLDDDFAAGNQAIEHDDRQQELYNTASNCFEKRDLIFIPMFSSIRGAIQFLKSFYKPHTMELVDWGVDLNHSSMINLPKHFPDRVHMIREFIAKHNSFPGNTSPLLPYLAENNIDLNVFSTDLTIVEDLDAEGQKARRYAELSTQDRNNLWNPVLEHLHDIGDFLKKLHYNKEQIIGDWGFNIDHSPQKPKARICILNPLREIALKGIVRGSVLTNMCNVELHIYKGVRKKGEPMIVLPKKMKGMNKGFSNIIVFNPSTIEKGKFKVFM